MKYNFFPIIAILKTISCNSGTSESNNETTTTDAIAVFTDSIAPTKIDSKMELSFKINLDYSG